MADFAYGPIEIMLVGLGSTKPHAGIVKALASTLESDTVRLIDMALVA